MSERCIRCRLPASLNLKRHTVRRGRTKTIKGGIAVKKKQLAIFGTALTAATALAGLGLHAHIRRKTQEPDFVVLSDIIPDAIQEIRYHSTYNFVGQRIDGYEQPCALLTRKAAEALREVSDEAAKLGYRLKIFDCYRPQRAVDHFVRWAEDVEDTAMKEVFYPKVDKKSLFSEGYITARSSHSRGSAVDLTLVDAITGREVDMGTAFDYFGEESHPNRLDGMTPDCLRGRFMLQDLMMDHGFVPLETEWWHFTLKDEPYPDTYFDFPVCEDAVKKKK
ncbi:MAG: M15 family metallopeptidase [Clostridia bacterium]|nr:M15 family metallopeptidase [Clostridia bacterium]